MAPLVFVTAARAETDIDTIEVYAGISPVLAMNCTDLNFGVWLLPVGTRAGPTYIEIASSGAATAQLTNADGVADNAVSLSAKFDTPAAGVCTVYTRTGDIGRRHSSFYGGEQYDDSGCSAGYPLWCIHRYCGAHNFV